MQKHIFIVDDNDANLTVAAAALENEFKIFTMPSAARMFSFLEKKSADIILLDVEMPEMSGFEAISKLKENSKWKDIPVIFVTGWIDDQLVTNALKAGALDVIKKPFSPDALLESVKKGIL